MQKTCWKVLGIVVGILGSQSVSQSAVTVTRMEYHGWKGAYRLANATTEVVVVPQIGRILRYGRIGGNNLLWENPKLSGKTTDFSKPVKDWNNYGGDKVWPSPQARWNWPPDPSFESAPHTAQVLPNKHLRLTSPVSKQHGIRFVREIALDATGTSVTITNTMVNAGEKDVEWGIWEVAQVDSPDVASLPLHPKGLFPKGYYVFKGNPPAPEMLHTESGRLHFRRHPKKNGKVGVDLPAGKLSARKSGHTIEIWATPAAIGNDYPDDGCALEIWSNPDPDSYMELELLSPITVLSPHDSAHFVTHWRLL